MPAGAAPPAVARTTSSARRGRLVRLPTVHGARVLLEEVPEHRAGRGRRWFHLVRELVHEGSLEQALVTGVVVRLAGCRKQNARSGSRSSRAGERSIARLNLL